MTTAPKIKLQGTNVSVCLLPPIEVLEARYKLCDDHEGIVARDFKLIPGKTRRGTSEGAPVGSYSNSSLSQQVEVTWMDRDAKQKVRVQKSRIVYRMANLDFDESLVIDHIDGNPNNNNPVNLRAVTYHENFGNRATAVKGKYPKRDAHLSTGVTRDYKFTSGVRYIGKTTIKGVTHKCYFESPRAAQHWLAAIKDKHLGSMARRDQWGVILGAPQWKSMK